jgi:probable O-glycosylation ligase (exosortase A-associated)
MLRTIFVASIVLLGLASSIVSPFWALMSYLWFAIFRPQEWMWFDITPLHLSLVLGILLVVRSVLSGTFPIVKHRLAIGLLLFWLTGLLAQFSAVRPDVGWEWLDYLGRLFIVSLLLARLADTVTRYVIAVMVISGSLAFHTAKAGIAFLIGGGVRFAEGLGGAYVDNNGYALAAVMIAPLLIAVSRNFPQVFPRLRAWRWGWTVSAPLTMLTVIGTYSRAGLLALIAAALVLVLLDRRRWRVLILCTAAIWLTLVFAPIPDSYFSRMQTIRTYEQVGDASALSRLYFWTVAWRMAQANPLGVGLRNFNYAFNRYDTSGYEYGESRSVHSSHLEVLTENGFLGALVWTALFFFSLRICWRIRADADRAPTAHAFFFHTMATALIGSMCGFIVGGAFIALSLNDITWLTFGLVIALDRLEQHERRQSPIPLAGAPAVAAPAVPSVQLGRRSGAYLGTSQ